MNIQVRNAEAQYDYFDDYAIRINVDEIYKHSEKLSETLNLPTINNPSIEFIGLEQSQEKSRTKVFALQTVTITKRHNYKDSGELDFNNYSISVLLQRPALIIPHKFTELGAFIVLLVKSVTTVNNYIQRDRPKVTNLTLYLILTL